MAVDHQQDADAARIIPQDFPISGAGRRALAWIRTWRACNMEGAFLADDKSFLSSALQRDPIIAALRIEARTGAGKAAAWLSGLKRMWRDCARA